MKSKFQTKIEMEANYLKENSTLTALTDFLNRNDKFKKQSGKPFTTNDVTQYIRLGHIPYYLGGNRIYESVLEVQGTKLYNLGELPRTKQN